MAFVGFAPSARWEQSDGVPAALWPQNIWPYTKNVIVLGIPDLCVGVLPAGRGFEGWDAANEILDMAAYRLSVYLNRMGYPSVNIPADSSGKNRPQYKTVPLFCHESAAFYGGIGPKGDGKPLRLASVLTALAWAEDDRLPECPGKYQKEKNAVCTPPGA